MHETDGDLHRLQRVLDQSYARAGEHLRSIFTTERRMSAEALCRTLRGVFLLHLATVTASCQPMVAPVDGLFFRGRFWFSLPPGAARAGHLRARPQVSGVYTRGEDVCVMVHGRAQEVGPGDPESVAFSDYGREVYGSAWDTGQARYRDRPGGGLTAWIEPRRLIAAGPGPAREG